jgi:3-deoxy-7-phosphoheptulonate synthase
LAVQRLWSLRALVLLNKQTSDGGGARGKDCRRGLIQGGAYKPRTSPYDFQGLGVEGLKLLAEAREKTGLPIVTEVLSTDDIGVVSEYADMLQ